MNKILIIVDMQNGFMTKPNYVDLKAKINNLIHKEKYTHHIFTKFINKENSLYETKLDWHGLKDIESQTICVDIPDNSIIMDKYGYGLSGGQIDFIKKLNVDCVDVCGLQTDACVYAIAFQLFDNGIYPNVLINYCETTPHRKEIAKEMIIHQFGSVDEKEDK